MSLYTGGVIAATQAEAPPGDDLPLQGFAANVTGGAGGQTILVTNGNDAGAGSFRQAVLDANGAGGAPRIIDIRFSTPGFITVSSTVSMTADNVTITGRNSPAPFYIRGSTPNTVPSSGWWDGPAFTTSGDNIFIEYIRIARGLGKPSGGNTGNTKNMFIFGTNTYVLHCTFFFGEDVVAAVWNGNTVTFQYCLYGLALHAAHHREGARFQQHNMGINFTGSSPGFDDVPIRACLIHSAGVHASERFGWRATRPHVEIANLITYNFNYGAGNGGTSNVRSSMFISGANSSQEPARKPFGSGGTNTYAEDILWLMKPGFIEERDPLNMRRQIGTLSPFKPDPWVWDPFIPAPITVFPVDTMWDDHLRTRVGATLPYRTTLEEAVVAELDAAVGRTSLLGQWASSPAAEDLSLSGFIIGNDCVDPSGYNYCTAGQQDVPQRWYADSWNAVL